MSKEEDYTPLKPTAAFAALSGNVKVTTRLFGPVSFERMATETALTQRRADQLNLVRVERLPRYDDDAVYVE